MRFWNIFSVINAAPLPKGARLRLRRIFLDRKLEKERRQIVKNGGNAGDIWEDGSWQFEYQMLEEDEATFHSRQLLNRARKLRIPTPPLMYEDSVSPDYQLSGLDGHRYFLSLIGEQKVRSAIREEERYRSERWTRRIPWLTALSGLIGTISGLVAVLAHWGS